MAARIRRIARRVVERVKNEPALLVAAVVAVANLVGVDPDQVEQLRTAVTETLVLLLGGGVVRSVVYGPKTASDALDAEAVIADRERG